MSSEETKFCVINYMDGKSLRFTFQSREEDSASTIGSAIEKLTNLNNLTFELEGRLTVIPMNNVRSIEFSPLAGKLPINMLRGKLIQD